MFEQDRKVSSIPSLNTQVILTSEANNLGERYPTLILPRPLSHHVNDAQIQYHGRMEYHTVLVHDSWEMCYLLMVTSTVPIFMINHQWTDTNVNFQAGSRPKFSQKKTKFKESKTTACQLSTVWPQLLLPESSRQSGVRWDKERQTQTWSLVHGYCASII